MKTISIINLKGGVGKTTTAVSLAEYLMLGDQKTKRHGSRVLLFDNDKQGNTSRLHGQYSPDAEAEACRILKTGTIKGNIKQTGYFNMDLIPCNYFMELAELEIKADAVHSQHERYKSALAEVATQYDYCIIDNPPDLGINVINAMVATDEIIIPVWLDAYSLDGLEELTEQIANIQTLNPKASLAGCLITDYEKTETAEAAETWIRHKSGCPVFETKIRHSRKAKDATFHKMPPGRYNSRSGIAQDYKAFVREYASMFGHRDEAARRGAYLHG
ncbi:MAG: ParA family protein [Acetatifactor sp.]|nr:ParA family protein [Acetatifactor sp.]